MNINKVILVLALMLSSVSGYYSIVGLASIFYSAYYPVVIMASILEASKIAVASWLFQRWNITPLPLKIYLTSAVIVLMSITSMGIYGFLSKAHVDMGLNNQELALRIQQMHVQRDSIQKTVDRYQSQLTQLDASINIKLQNNRSIDADATRKAQAPERADIKSKLDQASVQLQELVNQETELKSKLQVVESKVGPIKYVAELFMGSGNVDIDSAVRGMILMLVLVTDPLAVLLIIASNLTLVKKPKDDDEDNASSPYINFVQQQRADQAAMAESLREFGNSLSNSIGSTMGNSISELSRAVTELQRNQNEIKQVALPHTPLSDPTIGQMVWNDDQNSMMKWNGSEWQVVNLNIVAPEPASTGPVMDAAAVQRVVQESMDQWLSTALGEAKQKTETSKEVEQSVTSSSDNDSSVVKDEDSVVLNEVTKEVENSPKT